MEFEQTQAIELDFTQNERIEEIPIAKKVVAHLSIENVDEPGTDFPLYEGVNVIGRQKSNQVFIDKKPMSKLHAIIEMHNDLSALIFDLGSVNKTRKGKVFLQPHIRYNLENHEVLHFGNIKATFNLSMPQGVSGNEISETESESLIPKDLQGEESDSLIPQVSSPAKSKNLSPAKPNRSGSSKINFNVQSDDSTDSESNMTLRKKNVRKRLGRKKVISRPEPDSSDCETDDSLLSSPKKKLPISNKLQTNSSEDLLASSETTKSGPIRKEVLTVPAGLEENPTEIDSSKSSDKEVPPATCSFIENSLSITQLTEVPTEKDFMLCATQALNRELSDSQETSDAEIKEQPVVDCEQETQLLVSNNSTSAVSKIDLYAMTQPATSNHSFEFDSDDLEATKDLSNFHSNILTAETQPLVQPTLNDETKSIEMKISQNITTSVKKSTSSRISPKGKTTVVDNEIDLNAATQPVLWMSDFDDSDSFNASPDYKRINNNNPGTKNQCVSPNKICHSNNEKSLLSLETNPIPSSPRTSTFYQPGTSALKETNVKGLFNPNESEILCLESQPVKGINTSTSSNTCIDDSYAEKSSCTSVLAVETKDNERNSNEASNAKNLQDSSEVVESSIVFERSSKPISMSSQSGDTTAFNSDDELPDISPVNSKLNQPDLLCDIKEINPLLKITECSKTRELINSDCSSPLVFSDGINVNERPTSKQKTLKHCSNPPIRGIQKILVPATQDAKSDFSDMSIIPKIKIATAKVNSESDLPIKRNRRERKVPKRYSSENEQSTPGNANVKVKESTKKCVNAPKSSTKKCVNAPKSSVKRRINTKRSDQLDVESSEVVNSSSSNEIEPLSKQKESNTEKSELKPTGKKVTRTLRPPTIEASKAPQCDTISLPPTDELLSTKTTFSISYKKTKNNKSTSNILEHGFSNDKNQNISTVCMASPSVKRRKGSRTRKGHEEAVNLNSDSLVGLPVRGQSSSDTENAILHLDTGKSSALDKIKPVKANAKSTMRNKLVKKIKPQPKDAQGANLISGSSSAEKESEEEIFPSSKTGLTAKGKTCKDEEVRFKIPFDESIKTNNFRSEKDKLSIVEGQHLKDDELANRTNKHTKISTTCSSVSSSDNFEPVVLEQGCVLFKSSLDNKSSAELDTGEVIHLNETKPKKSNRKRKVNVLTDSHTAQTKSAVPVFPVLQSAIGTKRKILSKSSDSPTENQGSKRVSKRGVKNQTPMCSSDSETQENEIINKNHRKEPKKQSPPYKAIRSSSRTKQKDNVPAISPSNITDKVTSSHKAVENKSAMKSKRSASPDYSFVDKESPKKKQTGQLFNVMFTGFTDEKCEKVIKSLGGEVTCDINACTHLITDQLRRTCKLLCAVAKGIPVVNNKWIENAKKEKTLMNFNDYILSDKMAESRFCFKMEETLKKASKKPLLTGWQVHVTKGVTPGPDQMKDIIECAGATFLQKMPKKNEEKMVIITCKSDLHGCRNAKKCGISLVTVEFILAGLLSFELDLVKHKL